MYAKYQTDAIVLDSLPIGEADTHIVFFTHEFGLVRARASSTRRESSRMRYGLQSFMRSRVSLVRGRTGWRAAGAVAHASLGGCSGARAAFARIARLTIRLVPEAEKNEELFLLFIAAHSGFAAATSEQCALMELVCVARVLHVLGYLSSDALGSAHAADSLFSSDILSRAHAEKDVLLNSVNQALSGTHL